MKKFLVLILVAGGITAGLLNYHFILLDNKIKIMKKITMTFEDTYVDARGSKKLKLLLKRNLVKAGIKQALDDTKKAIKK